MQTKAHQKKEPVKKNSAFTEARKKELLAKDKARREGSQNVRSNLEQPLMPHPEGARDVISPTTGMMHYKKRFKLTSSTTDEPQNLIASTTSTTSTTSTHPSNGQSTARTVIPQASQTANDHGVLSVAHPNHGVVMEVNSDRAVVVPDRARQDMLGADSAHNSGAVDDEAADDTDKELYMCTGPQDDRGGGTGAEDVCSVSSSTAAITSTTSMGGVVVVDEPPQFLSKGVIQAGNAVDIEPVIAVTSRIHATPQLGSRKSVKSRSTGSALQHAKPNGGASSITSVETAHRLWAAAKSTKKGVAPTSASQRVPQKQKVKHSEKNPTRSRRFTAYVLYNKKVF